MFVPSAEDVILSKPQRYELGGRVWERQRLDLTGVIEVQSGSPYAAYLARWPGGLGVSSLLLEASAD